MRALAIAVTILTIAPAADVSADEAAPVRLVLVGSEPVGVRVAVGVTIPCDSSANEPLYRGTLKPGTTELASSAVCVCTQQTYAPFVTTGWSPGTITCRPAKRRRVADLSKPIVVELTSREP